MDTLLTLGVLGFAIEYTLTKLGYDVGTGAVSSSAHPQSNWIQVFDQIVCFLHRHLDACCTSCVSSHFHLGRVKSPYVMEPLSFQITPNSPSSCTV